MDAPDATVRLAMLKLMNPGGMPPMTQEEAQRLSTRMYLEGQNAQNVPTSTQTMQMRQGGPIDVNSYAGSMWSGPGSYTAPRLAPTSGSTMEQRADALLKQRFGTMLPGQTMREAGMRDEWMVPATEQAPAPAAQGIGGGSFLNAIKQPSGLESLLGYQFNAAAASAQPAARPAPQVQQSQGMFPGYKTPSPSVLQQMIGNATAPTPSMSNMTVAGALGMTPKAQELGLSRSRFQAEQQQNQEKSLLDTAASMMATGQDISGMNLNPSQMARVRTDAALLREKGQSTLRTVDEKGNPVQVTRDINGKVVAISPIQSPVQTPEELARGARLTTIAKGGAEAAMADLASYEKGYESAAAAENAALITEKALNSGKVTTGFGAPIAGYLKRVLSAANADAGVTEQELAQKGLAGMQAAGISAVMRGLGSMSNADREFAIQQFPAITDTERSIRFYVEMAKANAKFAREDQKLQRELKLAGNDPEVIAERMASIRNSRNIVPEIYDKVMKMPLASQKGAKPAATPSAPFSISDIQAEKKRRGL